MVLLPVLLSTFILLAANYIAQPHPLLKPKVFVIGLSKTGTTSIGDALDLIGYKRLGWKDVRSRHLIHTWANGDYNALIDQTRFYDAFEDLPWPRMYRQMAERYPDAKFILSLRKDEQTWLRSMHRHVGRGLWQPYAYFYGATQVVGNEQTVLSAYRNHTSEVRAYFHDQPHRYVELNIDDGERSWYALCKVAECPEGHVPSIGFPRANTAESWSNGWLFDEFHGLVRWSITRMEEFTSTSYYHGGWPIVNAVLGICWWVISLVDQACCELYYKMAIATDKPRPFT